MKLKDHSGAITDYTKAIELNSKYTNAYYNRGISRKSTEDIDGACVDWAKAARLGEKKASKLISDLCN
jgi:tetratricopeptide (TPR) repeat protein